MGIRNWLGINKPHTEDEPQTAKELERSRKERDAIERRLEALQIEINVIIREGGTRA